MALQHAHSVHETALGGVFGRGSSSIERGNGIGEIFHLVGVDLLRRRGRRHALQLLQLLFLGLASLQAAQGKVVKDTE